MKIAFRTIQIKAFLLLMIFTGNFFVVCHCSADAAVSTAMSRHCCCEKMDGMPKGGCPDKNACPGTRAVKFNLLEKQAAAVVHVVTPAATVLTREFFVPAAGDSFVKGNSSTCYFYKHSPPDRLALYHCYLI